MSKAYGLESLQRANIHVSDLGCVMLDVIMSPTVSEVLSEEFAYHSDSPEHWWVTGIQKDLHVSLLYGLIPSLVDQAGVDEVLDGWELPTFAADKLDVFRSPFPDEPYSCIVARVDCPELLDAHQRLSLLPHINTYPEFKAHVTLAYVKKEFESEVMNILQPLAPFVFVPRDINYGDIGEVMPRSLDAKLLDRVKDALSSHPKVCDEHPDDVITCGWKSAVRSVEWALDYREAEQDYHFY